MIDKIPQYVIEIIQKLETAGFEGFVVGGCVRDMLLDKTPKDWDVATLAKPEEILKIFPFGKYENAFGTVMIPRKYLLDLSIISKDLLISNEATEKLIGIAKLYISEIRCRAHGVKHSKNVEGYALDIAREYKDINPNFMRLLSYFHDTGRSKYDDVKHISESKIIFKKEATGILDTAVIEKIAEAMEHGHEEESKSLEQQILKEADVIDGIDVDRVIIVKEIDLKIHIDWLKNRFNDKYLYKLFLTSKGKELMQKAILAFNAVHKDLAISQMKEENNENIEITTYRIESKYTDKRHPDKVKFAKTLEEDLSRRDFTINAMAVRIADQGSTFPLSSVEADSNSSRSNLAHVPQDQTLKNSEYEIIDPYGGQDDLKNKRIKAVGKADDRFNEDALRMMRAIRFASTLNGNDKIQISNDKNPPPKADQPMAEKSKIQKIKSWEIEEDTLIAIKSNASNLKYISAERIKDEFEKIILSSDPAKGIKLLYETGLLFQFIPEMKEAVGFEQGFHHYHGPYRMVFDHMVASLEHCPSQKLEVRLACLFHDIGKPRTAGGKGIETTFYNHQYAGARMTREILKRLRFSRETIEKTVMLVQNHMFFYDVDQVGEAGVRRVVRRVGLENINDLIDVRIGDRLGSGVAKAVPYKLRHFKYMVEKVSKDPVSVKQLKINGNDLIDELKLEPGPKIGAILDVLLAKVIEEPKLNEKDDLLKLAKNLMDNDLDQLRLMAKEKIEEEKQEEDEAIKKKYWVK